MSKRQKQFDQLFAQMQAQLARSQVPTQYENDLNAQQGKLHNWLTSGDIKNPQDVNSFVNTTPLAQYAQNQQYSAGQPDGTSAMGVYNPQMMAANKIQHADDVNRKWGGMYEANKANIMGQQQQAADMSNQMYTNRLNQGIQGTSGLIDTLNKRPKGFNWASLIAPGIQAASAFF